MTIRTNSRTALGVATLAATCALTLGSAGCEDSDDNGSDAVELADDKFVITAQIYSPEGATTLVYAVDSLDDIEDLSAEDGFEFPGYSSASAFDGKVFAAPYGTANVERYAVFNDGSLALEDTVSFQNYGFQPGEGGTFVQDGKAYILGETPQHVVFNPDTMSIEGDFTVAEVPVKENYNRIRASTYGMMDGDNFIRTFFWQNSADVDFSEETVMAIVDTETDEVIAADEDDRCPVLNKMMKADDGTIYFSTWLYSATAHLVSDEPPTCILRKEPGATEFDQDWQLNFADITGGREGGQLFYLGGDMAIATVFHDELADVENAESPYTLAGTESWGYWLIDLDQMTGTQITSLPYSAGDARFMDADGTFYLFIPSGDYSETTAYSVTADGESQELFSVPGWIADVSRLN